MFWLAICANSLAFHTSIYHVYRSWHRSCAQNSRENTFIESLFNKVTGLHILNFIKKRLQYRCFPVNIGKFLRRTILKNIIERLLLCLLSLIWSNRVRTSWYLIIWLEITVQRSAMEFWVFPFSNWR